MTVRGQHFKPTLLGLKTWEWSNPTQCKKNRHYCGWTEKQQHFSWHGGQFCGKRAATHICSEHGVYTAHLPPTIWGLSKKKLQGLEGGQLYLLC